MIRERKRKKVGKVQFQNSVATPIDTLDFDKNTILPDVPCGHFAVGTLSETCFKDVVFEVNVRQQKTYIQLI